VRRHGRQHGRRRRRSRACGASRALHLSMCFRRAAARPRESPTRLLAREWRSRGAFAPALERAQTRWSRARARVRRRRRMRRRRRRRLRCCGCCGARQGSARPRRAALRARTRRPRRGNH
jgi:hypothetical protein